MRRLVFVEAGCLLDTWTMATRLVRTVRATDPSSAIRVIEAESARGSDPLAVHQLLWALLGDFCYASLPHSGCIDRIDALGRTAARVVRQHHRVGDTIVVVADLLPVFASAMKTHLRVDQVVCGAAPDGQLTDGFPGILLGSAAREAAERVARQESVALADCVTYGRAPRDRELLRIGEGIRIDYAGGLWPLAAIDHGHRAAS